SRSRLPLLSAASGQLTIAFTTAFAGGVPNQHRMWGLLPSGRTALSSATRANTMGCGLEVAHDLPQWSFRLMSSNAAITEPGVTYSAPDKPSIRWFVCFLLFLATTINYMD